MSGAGIVVFVAIGILVYLIMVVGIALFALHEDRIPRRAATLKRLAARWGGEAKSGYLTSEHFLRFAVDGVPAVLSFEGGEGDTTTRTRLRFDARVQGRLSIAPRGLLTRLFGGGDPGIADARFTDSFQVATSDEAWARDILDADLRSRLIKLREGGFGGLGKLFLDAGPAGVDFRADGSLLDEARTLEAFIEAGVAAVRRLRGEFVGVLAAGPGGCPVCGHPAPRPRACPSCKAPHHDECWAYMGGCAIFGCGARDRSAA